MWLLSLILFFFELTMTKITDMTNWVTYVTCYIGVDLVKINFLQNGIKIGVKSATLKHKGSKLQIFEHRGSKMQFNELSHTNFLEYYYIVWKVICH
jgi:hypothetical protein